MQRILDIDMDFFLNDVSHGPTDSTDRLSDEDNQYAPKSREYVISFLEENLGLTKTKRLRGRIVTHHNEAFYYWRDLLESGSLMSPFEVVHVDAHADLGLGSRSWPEIFTKLLALPLVERHIVEKYKNIPPPSLGDYLLYAIACRWIAKLEYIVHPTERGSDFLPYIIEYKSPRPIDYDGFSYCQGCWEGNPVTSCFIQLPHNAIDSPFDLNDPRKQADYIKKAILEPKVPFFIRKDYESIKYRHGDFDIVVFAQSPNYTPVSADFILDIISEYIEIDI